MTKPNRRTRDAVTAAAAAIERAADGATEKLTVLQAEVAVRDAEVERLQEICDDRQRVIHELGEHAETYRRAAEERAGLVAALDFDMQRLREDLERAERERNEARSEAETAKLALDEERQRARFVASEHDAELRAAYRDVESLSARGTVLEDALAGRTTLVDELQAACNERLALIERLSQEVATLRTIAEERRLVLEANEAQYQARARRAGRDDVPGADDGVNWRELAEERERALQELGAEAERRSVLLSEVTAALEGRTREVDDLRKRLTRVS